MKIFITKIIIILLCLNAFGQATDQTVYITDGDMSVLVFEIEPTFFNTSNKNISIQKEGNRLLLNYDIVKSDGSRIRSAAYFNDSVLLVEIESIFYKIKLSWTDDAEQIDYFKDFRQNTLNDCLAPDISNKGAVIRDVEKSKNLLDETIIKRVQERIELFKTNQITSSQIYSKPAVVNGFQARLVKGFVDDDHLYFRILLKNTNNLIYEISYTNVTYESKQKNNLLTDDSKLKVAVNPTYESDIFQIHSQESHSYYLAIPIYALDNKGRLKISFQEKNGMRHVQLDVPSNKIKNLAYIPVTAEFKETELTNKN